MEWTEGISELADLGASHANVADFTPEVGDSFGGTAAIEAAASNQPHVGQLAELRDNYVSARQSAVARGDTARAQTLSDRIQTLNDGIQSGDYAAAPAGWDEHVAQLRQASEASHPVELRHTRGNPKFEGVSDTELKARRDAAYKDRQRFHRHYNEHIAAYDEWRAPNAHLDNKSGAAWLEHDQNLRNENEVIERRYRELQAEIENRTPTSGIPALAGKARLITLGDRIG